MAGALALQMLRARPPYRAFSLPFSRVSIRRVQAAAHDEASKRIVFLGTPEVPHQNARF